MTSVGHAIRPGGACCRTHRFRQAASINVGSCSALSSASQPARTLPSCLAACETTNLASPSGTVVRSTGSLMRRSHQNRFEEVVAGRTVEQSPDGERTQRREATARKGTAATPSRSARRPCLSATPAMRDTGPRTVSPQHTCCHDESALRPACEHAWRLERDPLPVHLAAPRPPV
jgi:hypothetical protein